MFKNKIYLCSRYRIRAVDANKLTHSPQIPQCSVSPSQFFSADKMGDALRSAKPLIRVSARIQGTWNNEWAGFDVKTCPEGNESTGREEEGRVC